MKKILWLLIATLLIGTIAPIAAQESSREIKWWEETVWYLLFVRSFYDSDGDGIGDLRGVIEKLDYLNDGNPNTDTDLGITGIWLMPIVSAESYHGYDAVNYRMIDRDYGTIQDFQDLMAAAHERGIHIVVDYVINHTSDQHPWFIAASQNPSSPYRDWYIWEDENPGYEGPWGQNVWYRGSFNQYYYAVFWDRMPDLNHNNPDVRAEINETARFWLEDMGADGFRMDAIRYVMETEVDGRPILADSPVNRSYLAEFNAYVHSVKPDAMTVGEAWLDSATIISNYVEDGSVDTAFEFTIQAAIVSAAQTRSKRPLEQALRFTLYEFTPGTYATFTGNHDMPRLLTVLAFDEGKNRVAANLLFTLPGIPYIYYGEEIGMTGDKPDENMRRPFQWDASETGGFTTGTPWEALQTDYQEHNLADQADTPESLFSHYRNLIHLRNEYPALQYGDTLMVDSNYRSVLAYIRYTADETLLVIHNLDDEPAEEYALTLAESTLPAITSVELVYSSSEIMPNIPELTAEGGFENYLPFAPIPAQSLYVLRLNHE
jgi:alpha-amylase